MEVNVRALWWLLVLQVRVTTSAVVAVGGVALIGYVILELRNAGVLVPVIVQNFGAPGLCPPVAVAHEQSAFGLWAGTAMRPLYWLFTKVVLGVLSW